jgi:hypothetical protein
MHIWESFSVVEAIGINTTADDVFLRNHAALAYACRRSYNDTLQVSATLGPTQLTRKFMKNSRDMTTKGLCQLKVSFTDSWLETSIR